jgi:chemotaxis protein MotB
MARSLLSILSVSLVLGCVAQSEYDSALSDLDSARKAHSTIEQQLASCRDELAAAQADFDAELAERLAASEAELEELRRQRAAAEKRLEAFKALNDKLAELIAAGDLEVYFRNGLPVIALPSEVLFDSGKAELSKKGEASMTKLGTILAGMKEQRFQVVGHTDNMPIGKKLTWVDNWQLSAERALTVTRFLIAQGVAPDKLSAAGHGEYDPVASNDAAGWRKKNRRIELILLPDLSELQPVAENKAANE